MGEGGGAGKQGGSGLEGVEDGDDGREALPHGEVAWDGDDGVVGVGGLGYGRGGHHEEDQLGEREARPHAWGALPHGSEGRGWGGRHGQGARACAGRRGVAGAPRSQSPVAGGADTAGGPAGAALSVGQGGPARIFKVIGTCRQSFCNSQGV